MKCIMLLDLFLVRFSLIFLYIQCIVASAFYCMLLVNTRYRIVSYPSTDCRVLSLSDRRYSLDPFNQTRID